MKANYSAPHTMAVRFESKGIICDASQTQNPEIQIVNEWDPSVLVCV